MRKQFLKLFKITPLLFSAFLFCLYYGASNHDNGIPAELTPQQNLKAVSLAKDWVESLRNVCEAMDQFVDHPAAESEKISILINELESYKRLRKQISCVPEFFSTSVDLPEEVNSPVLTNACEQLSKASERMCAEVQRRSQTDDFDSAGYRRVENSFWSIVDSSDEYGFCDVRKCFWCKLRKHWEMN